MQIAMSNGRFAGDEKVYAEFSYHPRKNVVKTKEAGRDIYEDVPYVKIMVPGDKDNIVFRPVRESDKQRFPRQWQAFNTNEEQVVEGTLLSEWAGISRSLVEELKFYGVRTVEALVDMPDSQAQKFMGINALRQKAKAYIEDSRLMAPIDRLNRENEAMKAELAELRARLNGEEPPKPKRRRRAKPQVEDNGEIQVSE